MAGCRKCGGSKNVRFGSGQPHVEICHCPEVSAKPKPTSRLSVAEQLAVLVKLYEKGALTDQEFRILKTQLISRGE
jgi:hypothetical protein